MRQPIRRMTTGVLRGAVLLALLCAVLCTDARAQAAPQDPRVAACVLRGGIPEDCAAALGPPRPPPAAAAPAQAADCAQAETHWKSAEEIKSLAVYQDHLARFPTCVFAALARARIEQLGMPPRASPVTPTVPLDAAAVAWAAVKDTTSRAALEDFIRQFGSTPYGLMARGHLDDLNKGGIAVVAPPAPPLAEASPCGGAVAASLSSRPAQPLTAAEECALKPTDVFKECDKCPEMVVVPAGQFMLGAPKGDKDRFDDEQPMHPVAIAQPFAVGPFTVTFDEWDACVADGGCNGYRPKDRGWGRGRRPVINVSWNDAQTYLAWLSRKTGKDYRLLSEAEREYATRAGTLTKYWWGSSISPAQANYDEHLKRTVPVDSYPPNPWGLYQLHGNIYDWVEDCYHDSYNGAPSNGSAWTSGDCSQHVVRGGSWFARSWNLAAATRNSSPSIRDDQTGFRVARTLATRTTGDAPTQPPPQAALPPRADAIAELLNGKKLTVLVSCQRAGRANWIVSLSSSGNLLFEASVSKTEIVGGAADDGRFSYSATASGNRITVISIFKMDRNKRFTDTYQISGNSCSATHTVENGGEEQLDSTCKAVSCKVASVPPMVAVVRPDVPATAPNVPLGPPGPAPAAAVPTDAERRQADCIVGGGSLDECAKAEAAR